MLRDKPGVLHVHRDRSARSTGDAGQGRMGITSLGRPIFAGRRTSLRLRTLSGSTRSIGTTLCYTMIINTGKWETEDVAQVIIGALMNLKTVPQL